MEANGNNLNGGGVSQSLSKLIYSNKSDFLAFIILSCPSCCCRKMEMKALWKFKGIFLLQQMINRQKYMDPPTTVFYIFFENSVLL